MINNYRRRRYQCLDCGKKYSTIEVRVSSLRRGPKDGITVLRDIFGLSFEQQKALIAFLKAFKGYKTEL